MAGGALGTFLSDDICEPLFAAETPAQVKAGGPSGGHDNGYFPDLGSPISYGGGYPFVYIPPAVYSATSSGHPCGAGTSDPHCNLTF
jgi:hypothetical protein